MSEPIINREVIAARSEQDALYMLASGIPATCPYPVNSDAAASWAASLQRYLQLHRAPESEGSA